MQSFITISKLFGISIKLSVAEQLFELYITNPGESSWIGGWWQLLSVFLALVCAHVPVCGEAEAAAGVKFKICILDV